MKSDFSSFDEKIGPKSPLPYLLQLRNWVFGLKRPNIVVQLGFYFLFVVGFVFFAWNVLSTIALRMRFVVRENKNISIKDFLSERAVELEIHPDYILPKLLTFFSISAICWLLFLLATVLLWRQKKLFFWIGVGAVIFYIGMALFYVGGLFFWEGITSLDKLLVFACLIILAFYRFFLFSSSVK